jgi:hypothetical protein
VGGWRSGMQRQRSDGGGGTFHFVLAVPFLSTCRATILEFRIANFEMRIWGRRKTRWSWEYGLGSS